MHIEQRATICKEWLRINLKMTNNPTEKYQQRKRAGILEKSYQNPIGTSSLAARFELFTNIKNA